MQTLLKKLLKRLKPRDGMAVTAAVWAEAHNYHLWQHQAHILFNHGTGILTGLEIYTQTDEARRVWIKPGLAIDAQGRMAVVDELDSYVLNPEQEGLVYLFIEMTGENVLSSGSTASQRQALEVMEGYVISAAANLPPQAIELARIRLWGKNAEIKNAENPALPALNELDQRFRLELSSTAAQTSRVGISYVGQSTSQGLPPYGEQAGQLAQALSQSSDYRVWVDDDIPLSLDWLEPYTLVYLVEYPQASLGQVELDILTAYLRQGGTIFVENYQNTSTSTSPLFNQLAQNLRLEVSNLSTQHPLLWQPNFFAMPPAGGNRQGSIQVGRYQNGQTVIGSTCQYGYFWQRRGPSGQLPEREQLRAAQEWAVNLISYASQQHRQNQA